MQKYISLFLTLAFVVCFSVQADAQSRKQLKQENQKLQRQVDSLENEIKNRLDKIAKDLEDTNRNQIALAAKPQNIYEAARNDNQELFEKLMFNHRANPNIAYEMVTVANHENPVQLPLFCAVATTNNVSAVDFFIKWGIVRDPFFVCSRNANNEPEFVTQYASDDVLEYLIEQNFLIADPLTLLRGYCILGCVEDNTVCSNYVDLYSYFLKNIEEENSIFSSFASYLLQKSYQEATEFYCNAKVNGPVMKLWWMK